jgi:hypothetical protein
MVQVYWVNSHLLHANADKTAHLRLLVELEVVGISLDPLGGDRLGALDGETVDAVPDELREDSEGTGDTEQDSVVLVLLEAVVLKENTRVGINVGPGILGLTMLLENDRGSLIDERDKLEEGVVGHVLKSILALASVTRIGLTEHSVTVTRNNLTGLEGVPEGLSDLLLGRAGGSELLLKSSDPT